MLNLHQGNGRATTSMVKAHGDYEHWLWALFPKANVEAGCRTVMPPTWCWPAMTFSGTSLTRVKISIVSAADGLPSLRRLRPRTEDMNTVSQQIQTVPRDKRKTTSNRRPYLMKQADSASSNEAANEFNAKAVALRVAKTATRRRIKQLDYQSTA